MTKDLCKRVQQEYGDGWDVKRVALTVALAAGILGGAFYGATRSYTPVVKTEQRIEQREKTSYVPERKDYVAVDK